MPNTYDVGDEVRVTGTLTNSSSTNTDPGALTVKYKNPAGTVTTKVYDTDPEVVRSATGIYYIDITVDAAGYWFYRFASSTSGVASAEGYFDVVESHFS